MDQPAPVVSVIIPCYNAADTIEAALDSVLQEGDVPLECIVVDDASTDDTITIVGRVAARDPRLMLLRSETNAGVSAARNRALDVASGEWLTFVDADDLLLPGAVSTLLGPTRAGDALAVIGQHVWSDGQRTWQTSLYAIPDITTAGRKSLVSAPGLMYHASGHGKLFHRSLADGLRFHGRVLGDQPWTLRALIRAQDRIEVIEETVYVWRRQSSSTDPRGITSITRGSARGSAEAVEVATGALREVREEAERTLRDPAAQRVIAVGYLERLLRSDLGDFVRKAIDRGDPLLPELLSAVSAFLDSVPPSDLVADSETLSRAVLKPIVDGWPRLTPDARRQGASMIKAARTMDPTIMQWAGGGRAVRAALRVRLAWDNRITDALLDAAARRDARARARSAADRAVS